MKIEDFDQRKGMTPLYLDAHCEWPGCGNPGFCSSGDVEGGMVCRKHFAFTNGERAKDRADWICIVAIIGARRALGKT